MITRATLSTIEQGLPKYRSMLAGNPAFSPPSFESIATVTLSSNASTITFNSIPQTYKHLQIRALTKSESGQTSYGYLFMKSNSDSGYARHSLLGNGSAASASSGTGETFFQIRAGEPYTGNVGANIFGVSIIDIIDYASTTKNKTFRAFAGWDGNGAGGGNEGVIALTSGLATTTGTTAISSLVFYDGSQANFLAGSTISLYGIKGA
jgi:hypothetical protein